MGDERTDYDDRDDRDPIDGVTADEHGEATEADGRLPGITGSRDDLTADDDPDGHARAATQDDIDAGVAEASNRSGG